MEAVRAFLDANILFSASLGGGSFGLFWELSKAGKVALYTSRYCYLEAIGNLQRKHSQSLPKFHELMQSVSYVVDEESTHLEWALALIREKDVPVLTAAVEAKVDVLITGDLRDFGHLMNRKDLPIAVMTLRTFLLEWSV